MSDVQSIYIPSSIRGLIPGGQNLSKRQTVLFLPVDPMDKNHKDPDTINLEAPRHAQYMHKAWKKHKNTVSWVDINLALKKDWSSVKHDRTLSFFTKHSQLIVSRRLLRLKLGKSYTRKYMRFLVLHQRFPWNMTGWKNLVQKLLDNQMEKLFNNPKIPNQAKQIQTQIMRERGNTLSVATQGPRQVPPKHVPLMTARTSMLKMKQIMIERWNPLFAVMQVTRKVPPKHVPLMKARTSMLKMKQIMIKRWNPLFAVMQITSNQC